jgi:hypothetical protein
MSCPAHTRCENPAASCVGGLRVAEASKSADCTPRV